MARPTPNVLGEGVTARARQIAAQLSLFAPLRRRGSRSASSLTPRERQLVSLLLEGLDTRELVARLFISRHTVQDHLKSISQKLGVCSRRELVSNVFAETG
jgi:DNA-binding CsgD family transcriptional regulator